MKSNHHKFVFGVVTIGLGILFLTSAFSGVVLAQPNPIVETESANIQLTNAVRTLPERIDHSSDESTKDYFPPIGDQGSKGSCSAWAMVYYSLGYREAINRQWTDAHTGNNKAHLLSPEFSFNIANGGTFNPLNNLAGVSRKVIGNIITDWGTPTWSKMPYHGYTTDLDYGDETAWSEAPLHRAEFIKDNDSTFQPAYNNLSSYLSQKSHVSWDEGNE